MQAPVNSPSDWLRPEVMLPVGVTLLIAGVGGLFSLIKIFRSRQRKEISYSIVSDTLLANIQDNISTKEIKVTVDGKKVNNVRFVSLRIRNSGNVPIRQEDYEVPLWFIPANVYGNGNVVDAGVTSTEPIGISAVAQINANSQVGLNSFLLNPGDVIYVGILLSDYSELIQVFGRITGVNEIKLEQFAVKQPTKMSTLFGQGVAVLLICMILASVIDLPLALVYKINFLNTLWIITFTLVSLFAAYFIFSKIKLLFHK